MQKYLAFLDRISLNVKENQLYLIDLLRQFILGKISDYELCNSLNSEDVFTFCTLMNKVLDCNFSNDVRYFIELPRDRDFNTMLSKGIFAGKTLSYGIDHDLLKVVGPSFVKLQADIFDTTSFTEIKGNFSNIPNGAMISTRDWFKVISKYPDLYDYILNSYDNIPFRLNSDIFSCPSYYYSHHDLENKIKEGLNKVDKVIPRIHWYAYSSQIELSDEVINSIRFVIQESFVTVCDIEDCNLGTFKELVNGSKRDKHAYVYNFPNTHKKLV